MMKLTSMKSKTSYNTAAMSSKGVSAVTGQDFRETATLYTDWQAGHEH